MNALFVVILVICTISEWCGCGRIHEKFEPIEVFTFPTSKFQVKDIIDSIVKQDATLAFQELTDFIDTFILERAFCLTRIDNPDSIKYFYYFSGDVKEWLINTDSTFLVLSYISVKGKTYDAKAIKNTDDEKINKILYLFNQYVINPAIEYVKVLPRYDIRLINSVRGGVLSEKGVICRERKRCDTLLLKYIDGGKYTGIPLIGQ